MNSLQGVKKRVVSEKDQIERESGRLEASHCKLPLEYVSSVLVK